MTRVVGVDLSLTSTGLATVLDTLDGFTGRVESSPPKRARGDKTRATVAERSERIRLIVTAVRRWCGTDVPALAVLEAPSYASAGAGTWDRAWLWGSAVDALRSADVPVAIVPPRARALWASGSGAASKSPIAVHMSRMWPQVDPSISDDEWDALALASIGAQYLGVLPIKLERHRDQLTKVEWPDIPAGIELAS